MTIDKSTIICDIVQYTDMSYKLPSDGSFRNVV
jgi:hypothetical protein